ncbi:hypothetical protein E4H12_01645 [Candidatus Thorarchaeota archaeon]|nr:MAG: hypothetical protein E4H12_01645 [Candidatus Thorarchaeota archaeon]
MNRFNGRGRTLLIGFSLSLLLFSFLGSNSPSVFETTMAGNNVTPASSLGTIVIDYSHGQESTQTTVAEDDALLGTELEAMGYTVIWARGGLNTSILSGADGLLIASILGDTNVFLSSEIDAIAEWFNGGSKFLWIGCDSDFTSLPSQGQFVNDNMCQVLEAVGSHVYPEPTAVEDPESNAGASYRTIANQTSDDPFVFDIVSNVGTVLMHGPTLVYGSANENNPGVGVDPIPLELMTIDDVYPLLYYSDFAQIIDSDITPPIAHDDGDIGGFVAATLEINSGSSGSGMIITSGASPYADYYSMHLDDYYSTWNGSTFVTQAIDFCMSHLGPSIDNPSDVTYEEGRDIPVMFETITWHPNSDSPKFFNITLNDSPIKDGLWNSSSEEISINIEGLLQGIYNYTIIVENTNNQTASDSVFVTVLAQDAPVVNHPANITYTVGETGNIIHWEISDTSFKDFSLYVDGVNVCTVIGMLNLIPHTLTYDYSVDGYALGLYNLTLVVTDWLDFVSTDTVWVEVIPEPTTTSTTDTTTTTDTSTATITTIPSTPTTGDGSGNLLETMTIIISIGSIVIIVIVIILIKRKP